MNKRTKSLTDIYDLTLFIVWQSPTGNWSLKILEKYSLCTYHWRIQLIREPKLPLTGPTCSNYNGHIHVNRFIRFFNWSFSPITLIKTRFWLTPISIMYKLINYRTLKINLSLDKRPSDLDSHLSIIALRLPGHGVSSSFWSLNQI